MTALPSYDDSMHAAFAYDVVTSDAEEAADWVERWDEARAPQCSLQSATPLLDHVSEPAALRQLPLSCLRRLADELRHETIETVAETGGHLGAGLGVVELTVALHYVFATPDARLIWDVSHQSYPHKILTGRRDRMRTLRQPGGLSGFTRRSESRFDPFGAAHSSTSISAGIGMAVAARLQDQKRDVVAVIGDGAMSAGMAYEAMNNVAAARGRLIVVLNDNDMSIAAPTGALRGHLASLRGVRSTASTSLFESLGFDYRGPVDGHDVEALVATLRDVRDLASNRPVLVHVVTRKGQGYAPAMAAADRLHGVVPFDIATGKQQKPAAAAPSYTGVFAGSLIAEARRDPTLVAITAAMPAGTGLDKFAAAFPDRFFDVGIAEQHAVTFAAGLAADGCRPFCAIYSTFLQRAYDQIVHDVALQRLPVRFAIDRAGLVGADGATHAGSFDIAYLGCLPNMVLMAPADEEELARMVATAARHDAGPIAFRYPRGDGVGLTMPVESLPLTIGRGRVVAEGSDAVLLSYGTRLQACRKAASALEAQGLSVMLADARFAKPLDEALIRRLARAHPVMLTLEDGASGGFSAAVQRFLLEDGLLDTGKLKLRSLTLPDRFLDHGTSATQDAQAGLDAAAIAAAVVRLCAH